MSFGGPGDHELFQNSKVHGCRLYSNNAREIQGEHQAPAVHLGHIPIRSEDSKRSCSFHVLRKELRSELEMSSFKDSYFTNCDK